MTNEDFKRRYSAIFTDRFLISHQGRSVLAFTNRKPTPNSDAFAYIPEIDDFVKLRHDDIVAVVRLTSRKSQV